MGRAWVPVFIKDRRMQAAKGLEEATEWVRVEEEGPLLPGPACARVAVLDFEPASGALNPGLPFRDAARADRAGRWLSQEEMRFDSAESIAVHAFGTVMKTIYQYERKDCLGRPVSWAFDGPQLLVVPRAGRWENAFYERESRSLQFFFFADATGGGTVYAAQSQDIVAHETAHAILDGIAPDLYHATTPQSLAIHEGVADLTAVLSAVSSRALRRAVLAQTGGSLEGWNAFSALAGEFAHALDPHDTALRELFRRQTLRHVPSDEPHALSVVLAGALYRVLLFLYDEIRGRRLDVHVPSAAGERPADAPGAAGREPETPDEDALEKAGRRFRRTILRALDYLPPGELSFADFGRAILAADQASHPESDGQREWLVKEFVARGIVKDAAAMAVRPPFSDPALKDLDLDALLSGDYAAYRFAEEHREFLGLPANGPFKLEPRRATHKVTWHKDGPEDIDEVLFKVSWTDVETVGSKASPWPNRHVVHGTTLSIDRRTRWARALLSTSAKDGLARSRDALLTSLLATRGIVPEDEAVGLDGRPLRGVAIGRTVDGALRARNTVNLLHLARPGR